MSRDGEALGLFTSRAIRAPLTDLPPGGAVGGISWLACRGVSDEARGYPCGLWLLFHALVAHTPDAAAASALKRIRGYVAHFFGCDACAHHFVSLANDAALAKVDGVHSAALWLWRAHNAVNLRLNRSGEGTVLRYGLSKVQWPPRDVCPGCRTPSGRWRESAVLAHLRGSYCLHESECALDRGRAEGDAAPAEEEDAATWGPALQLAIFACVAAVRCCTPRQQRTASQQLPTVPVAHGSLMPTVHSLRRSYGTLPCDGR